MISQFTRSPGSRAFGTRRSPLLTTAGVLAALVAAAVSTHASSFYWTGDNSAFWNGTGGPAGTNWSSSPDFNNGTAGLPTATDDVFFNLFGAGNLNTQLGQDFAIKSLTFTTDATNPVTIGGANTLTLGTGGLTKNSNALVTLNTNLTLAASQTWTNNSLANALTVNGVIGGTGTNLTLAGAGAFSFSGANTYTGATNLLSNGTALTLTGASGALASASLSLEGGTTLNLDNTVSNNTNRVGDTAAIISKGATLALKGTTATETLGTLTASTGTTRVNVDAGSQLMLSGLARGTGGTINFSTTGTINIPTASNTNGLLGGWTTIGNVGSVQQDANGNANVLNFASVDASKNVVPFTAYNLNDFSAPANNTKVDGTAGTINLAAASTTINSLYLTGGAIVAFNGSTTNTLIIGSGGIISNAATLTLGGAGPQIDLVNSAELGSGFVSGTGAGGGAIQGIVTSATGELVVTTASNLRIDAVIANNGATVVSLTKNGSGTLDLSDGNQNTATSTYSGITTINGGLVTIRNDRNLGAVPGANTPNSLTLNGGELRMTATITLASQRGITVGPQGGTISYNGGNTTHLTGYLVTGSGSITYSNIPGFGNVSANQCAMDIGFTTTNYQGGTTFFTQGSTSGNPITSVIFFSGNDKVPDTSPVTVTNNDGKGILNLFGKSDTWGSLAGNGNILNGVATMSNLTVGGNNLSTTYSGSLGVVGATWAVGANNNTGADNSTGSSPAITLTKVGTGTMTLAGSNKYTGATNINGGAILVTGSLDNTIVTVGNGALNGTLGGSGVINGPVNVTASGHLAPAVAPTTTSTLTINNNLTLVSGGVLDFNFATAGGIGGATGVGDFVNVVGPGNLTLSGGLTLNITALPGFGIGLYKLLALGGIGTFNSTAAFTINGTNLFNYSVLNAGGAISPSVGGGNVPANNIYLQVLQGNPALFWTGSVNNVWDLGTTANWSSGVPTTFVNTANVTFDASGANTAINVTQAVAPNSITMNNSGPYSFSGAAINVATSLTKNQPGTLTINNVVNVTNQTLVNNGTLTVGLSGSLNSATTRVEASGTLNVAGALGTATALVTNGAVNFTNAAQTIAALGDTANATTGVVNLAGTALTVTSASTYDGTLTGTGSLTKNTNGTLTLSNGASTYSGGTTVSGTGVALNLTNATGSSTGTGPVTVSTNAALTGPGRIGGNLIIGPGGHLAPGNSGLGSLTVGGGVTLNPGSVLDYEFAAPGTNDTVSLAGALSLPAGADTLNLMALPGFTVGNYVLFTAGNPVTNNATFTVNATGAGLSPFINYSVAAQGNQLVLTVDVTSKTWTGAVSGAWDAAAANWTPGGTWVDGNRAIFNDSGAAHAQVAVDAAGVLPFQITFNNTTAVPYTLDGPGAVGGGASLLKGNTGTVTVTGFNTFTGSTTITGGTLSISSDVNLGTAPATPTPGQITLAGGTLQGNSPGVLFLNVNRGLALGAGTNTIDSTPGSNINYGGVVANVTGQNGVLTKTGDGLLDLYGINTYTGGTVVKGGIVNLGVSATPAGTGPVTINTGGAVNVDAANLPNAFILAGGRLGNSNARTLTGDVTAQAGTSSNIDLYDERTPATASELVFNGVLHGSGTLTLNPVATQTDPNGGLGVRLRNTATNSDFSGIINLSPGMKLEIRSAGGNFSAAGTATINMAAGLSAQPSSATAYTQLNLRTDSPTRYAHNINITGPGIVNIFGAQIGTGVVNSIVTVDALTIGDQQTLVSSSNAVATYSLAFSAVHLNGGNATFDGNFLNAGTQPLILGPINELVPGSGFTKASTNNLTLTAANSFTGPVNVTGGTLILGAAGALPSGTVLSVNGGTVDLNTLGVSNDATVRNLSGSSGSITNTDPVNTRTFTVNELADTSFAGSLTGLLNFVKTGPANLNVIGFVSPASTTVNAGTLSVNGFLSGGLTVTGTGSVLAGSGTVGAVAVQNGGRISPGNSPGILATGTLAMAPGTSLAVELNGTTPGSDYDQLNVAGTVNLSNATLSLSGSYLTAPVATNDTFFILLNDDVDPITGTFAGLPQGAVLFSTSGQPFTITYVADSTTTALLGGNDIALVALPEPGSAALILGGLACLATRRRRRSSYA